MTLIKLVYLFSINLPYTKNNNYNIINIQYFQVINK